MAACTRPNMARLTVFLLLASAAAFVAAQDAVLPRLLDRFYVKHPAFVQLFPTEADVDPLDKYSLYVSNFDALAMFQTDDIYVMRSPGRQLSDVANWNMTLIDQDNFWPNDPCYMPSNVLGREGVIWTSGFLVPGKTAGQLNIYFTDVDPVEGPFNIASLDELQYSYHRVIWHDVNHDGNIDALAARFILPTVGDPTLEFLWFENPGTGPSEGWAQHLIFENGPDVHYRMTTFQVAGQDFTVVVGAEFFSERLSIYYAADGSDSFLSDPSTLIQRVLDDTVVGQTFDLDIGDLNLDGNPEIVICGYNHSLGSVFVFPLPADFRTDAWERITIADGFDPHPSVGGQVMSPGAPQPFFKGVAHEQSGDKPYVFVSGDDDGRHYILEPMSQDKDDWTYTTHLLVDTGATTTGKFSIADIDNDGNNEIVAAAFSASEVYVYTYAP